MKRLVMGLALAILLLLPVPLQAAEEPAFSWQDAVENIDLEVMEEYKNRIDGEISSYMETKPVKEWLQDFIKGDWEFSFEELTQNLVKFFFKEVVVNSNLLGRLLILSVLSALLVNLQSAFSSGVARISQLACFMALAAIALGSFRLVLEIGQNTIDLMVSFMMGMLPQMLVLVAGLGNVHTAATLFPVLMTTCTAFANAMQNIVFPLIILSAILSLVNHLSEGLKVEKMAKFFGQMAQLALAFFLTLFVGMLTLRAVYSSVMDKLALRTTKFVTDNAIPVVGKMFSDTIEVAAGYVVMIKQAIGIFGVIIILGIVLFPLIKVGTIALIYKIAAAIAEPLGDSRTAAILDAMSAHLFLMLAAVAAVALMFFIMIAIVVGMSNHLAALP